jgi:hypothetical protein
MTGSARRPILAAMADREPVPERAEELLDLRVQLIEARERRDAASPGSNEWFDATIEIDALTREIWGDRDRPRPSPTR